MPADGISEVRAGRTTKIQSGAGGEFDCYVAVPKSNDTVPAIVLASAVHGVDADICAIADEFAATAFWPRRLTCSGARIPDRCRTTMGAWGSALNRGSTGSKKASAI